MGLPVRGKRWRLGLLWAALALALVVAFSAGFLTARGTTLASGLLPGAAARAALASSRPVDNASTTTQASGPLDTQPPDNLGHQLDPFWEAWNFVEREYYRHPVDRTKLVQGAIKGMLASLGDQYASYLDSNANRVEKANLDGIIEGIGASVEMKDRRHTIVAPIEDSPAYKVGLKSGDVILKVDGKEIGSLSLAEAVSMVRGPAGTKVKLTIQRVDDPDGPPMEVEITRARIELETVSGRLVAEGIGYVRIRLFGTQTMPQLTRTLRDMRARRVRGLVVDLRDNPGGYLSSAVEVASQFLKDGSVVVYEEREGTRRPSIAKMGGLATDLTLAVLVNRGSASASEIVAGALRDHNRAVLIGEQTFGKGSVQLPKELSDGSAVRVTVGTWLTPAGKQIQGQGLAPTIEVKPTPEDEKVKRDVVLERALEWFKATPLPDAASVG